MPTWRDVLIAKTLRATGLRVMELLRLERRHYDVSGPEFSILVRRNKRRIKHKGEYARVYLPPGLGVELRDYINGNRIAPENRVFPITDRQVRYVFAAAGRKGNGRPVHPRKGCHTEGCSHFFKRHRSAQTKGVANYPVTTYLFLPSTQPPN